MVWLRCAEQWDFNHSGAPLCCISFFPVFFAETLGVVSCHFIAPLFPALSSFLSATGLGTWCRLKPNPNHVVLQCALPAKLQTRSWHGLVLQISFIGGMGSALEARVVITDGTAQETDLWAMPPGSGMGMHLVIATCQHLFPKTFC